MRISRKLLWFGSIFGIIMFITLFFNFYNPHQFDKCYSVFSLNYWYAFKDFWKFGKYYIPPVKVNFSDIQIKLQYPVFRLGKIYPMLRLGHKICLLEFNIEKIFFPISRQEVVKYIDYMESIRSIPRSFHTTIYNQEQYQDKNLVCDTNIPKELQHITTVIEQEGKFIVNRIYYDSYGTSGYYKAQFEVSKNGKIIITKPAEQFFACGRGIEL